MGLSAFFAAFRGSKAKRDAPSPSSPSRDRPIHAPSPATRRARGEYVREASQPVAAPRAAPPSAAQAQGESAAREKTKTRSRKFTLSRSKSQHESKQRRSWFGGRPDSDQHPPAVPLLVYDGNQRPALPTNENPSPTPESTWRTSIRRSLSRKRKNPKRDERPVSGRSWFSSRRDTITAETLPPLPPIPVVITQSQSATSTLPMQQRRSRAASIKSVSSVKTAKSNRKTQSLWQSSNSEDSDSDVPPVPALVRDERSETESTSSIDNTDRSQSYVVNVGMSEGIKSRRTRTASVDTERTYRPHSAARGFLKSTHDASEESRTSYRQSFRLNDDADIVCLTEEQQAEWVRLMSREDETENQISRHHSNEVDSINEKSSGRTKYSNAQALAALEFGLRG